MKPKNRLLLAHGFNVRDGGANTLDKLIPHLKRPNTKIKQADYGHLSLAGVAYFNDNLAAMLNGLSEQNDIGIGHSNGCSVLAMAANLGAPFKQLHLINPALKSDFKFPSHIKKIFVYHSKGDLPVKLSTWLRYIPPFKNNKDFIWGQMGATGYTGNDPRVINIDLSSMYLSHSGGFDNQNAPELAAIIRDKIKRG